MIHSFTSSILAQSAPPAAPDNTTGSLLMMGMMIVVFWLFLIRPQQKRQKEMNARIAALKTGDKVVTTGGIHGSGKLTTGGLIWLAIWSVTFASMAA